MIRDRPPATMQASDTLFGRDYNEALIHQVVTAYLANTRPATGPRRVVPKCRSRLASRGARKVPAVLVPVWLPARSGVEVAAVPPNSPGRNFTQKVNRKMYRAGVASILSQLAREDRLAVVGPSMSRRPRPSSCRRSSRAWVWSRCRHYRQSRREPFPVLAQPAACAGSRGSKADPVSLVRFPKVLVTRGAVAKMEEMWQ